MFPAKYVSEVKNTILKYYHFIVVYRYVLTGAHCITNELKFVRLGEWDLESEIDCMTVAEQKVCADEVQNIGIEHTIKHKRYVKGKNDIALVKLNRDVVFSDFIAPVCLPKEKSSILEDKKLVAIGFGVTETKFKSRFKQFVLLPYIKPEVCEQKTHSLYRQRIDYNKTICTYSSENKDTCGGDSGGSLVDNVSQYYILRGITALGLGECSNATNIFPGYSTDVYEYLDWINLHMNP